ncbi:MAG: hypothetical protein LBK91_04060 [Synergistaceae bacterium]|nr:hypothetical protein [Synergistaceae bacterium]
MCFSEEIVTYSKKSRKKKAKYNEEPLKFKEASVEPRLPHGFERHAGIMRFHHHLSSRRVKFKSMRFMRSGIVMASTSSRSRAHAQRWKYK